MEAKNEIVIAKNEKRKEYFLKKVLREMNKEKINRRKYVKKESINSMKEKEINTKRRRGDQTNIKTEEAWIYINKYRNKRKKVDESI